MKIRKLISFISLLLIVLLVMGCTADKEDIVSESKNKEEETEVIDIKEIECEDIEFDLTYLPSDDERSTQIENIIKKYLGYNKSEIGEIRYFHHPIYINDDHENLAFVYLLGDYVSSAGGGTGLIVDLDISEVLFEFNRINNPIIISEERTNGWNDIVIQIFDNHKPELVKLIYDGEKYPSYPTVEDKVIDEKIKGFAIIAEKIGDDDGFKLD